MTTIYLIRHGHSQGNLKNLFIGQGNLDLTEKGYEQAGKTANYLKDYKVDAIYSSDLDRAYHTALELAKLKDLTVNKDKRLREIFAGEWEGMSFADIKVKFNKDYAPWANDIGNSVCTGGETYAEVQSRMVEAVTEIARNNDGKSVAIFSHATSIHTFCSFVLGLDLNDANKISFVGNASMTTITFDSGKFEMKRYGYDDFMGDMKTKLSF